MGPDVPLLNDYKQEFFWKRFPQTVLGGPRFKLGYCAPPYVYLHQVALFLAPWLLGGVGTLLYQLRLLSDVQAGLLSGALMLVAGAALQGLAWAAARRRSARRTTTPPRRANHLHLADEEEEVEFTRCLAPETLHFVVPGKRLAVNAALHAVLAGTLCGLGTWYLLPDRLYRALYRVEGGLEAAGAGATVPVLALSWVTLCIAEYSLIVNTAAETATFQPQDTYEIAPLTRPMYILAFVLVDLALSCVGGGVSELEVASQVLHVVFVLLPVLWALGMLPPLDALLLWAMEQGLVHALGGSPMASNRRLVAMFLLSSCVAIIAFFIPSSFAVVLFSVAAGYLLSQDLTQVTALAGRRRVASSSSSSSASSLGLGWCWLPLSLLLLAGSVSEAGLLHQFCPSRGGNSSSLPGVWKPDPDPEPGCDASALQSALGWLLIALLLATRALGGLQGACWGGGLFLNPLYPRQVSSVQVFRRKTRHLRAAGLARRVLLNLVSPFAMIAFLAVDSSLQNLHTASMAVGFTRAFRVVWQSSEDALLQMAVVVVLMLAPGHDALRLWHQLGIGVQLVVVSLVCDRLHQFKEKLKFALTVLITSWTETKQRRQCAGALLALNAALWPLLLGVVLLCALLSAPLLPLFTLPVFLVAFPRPQRSWPGTPGTACPCPDSVYYQQLGARLAHALKQPLANGVLGSCSPGSHFLARFQDRVVWISVLEKGYGYCTLNVKGLELQETSCHTVEARRVDEVFEGAFDRLERPGRLHLRLLNPHWGNTLTPASAVPALVYSDSRNVLTGIIDSPDHLRQLRSDFLKALLWVLLRHCVHDDARTPRARPFQPSGRKSQSSRPESRHEPGARDTKAGADSRPGSSISPSNLRGRQSSSSSSSSSFADWSDDDDLFGPVPARKPVRTITVRTQDGQTGTQPAVSLPGSVEIHSLYENMAMASLPTLRPLGLGLGMPAVDLGGNGDGNGGGNGDVHGDEPPLVAPDDASSNPSEPLEFSCPFSERLSLPPSWRSAPLPHARLQPLRSVFPEDWFRFCLARLASEGLCDGEAERVCGALQEDRVLREMYARVVLSCAAALGADAPVPSPSLVFRVYCGDGPRPDAFDWLRAEKELHQLTLRAFRYSVKLLIDQASLGPMESQAELYSTLQDYNSHWFIGLTTERGWSEAVLQEKPFLFSLGHDLTMGTYTGRVLWLQESALQLGVLNSECVRGQWANLAWELLYVTNDDEERYSMQAHPVLLRNLTVQAADPPLGYPVYSSPPLHLACL